MLIQSETAMRTFGKDFAKNLSFPAVIELIGDVGVGKTTFTQGLAEGLGITESVTSPSFTISKRYVFPLPQKCCKNYNISSPEHPVGELVHYDFYRLDDPGIMRDELTETITNPYSVTVIEWGGGVTDLLPKQKYRLEIKLNADGAREVQVTSEGAQIA